MQRIFYQDSAVCIRSMEESDSQGMAESFRLQGWDKPSWQFEAYYKEQENGEKTVFVALYEQRFAGYVTLVKSTSIGPFAGNNIPEIRDFNVLIAYRRRGIGTLLMDAAEAEASLLSGTVSIGVGLHPGYGTAQRMYVKRGYVPDGSGVWYQDRVLKPFEPCRNDDDLVLYFSKGLAGGKTDIAR